MSIFFYIIGYIVLSIAIAYYLKSRKNKANEINKYSKAKQIKNKIFDRRKHNDYMNNPKFSYMSCNKYNPESPFFKKRKSIKTNESGIYVLLKQAEYESLRNPHDINNESITSQMNKASMGCPNKYYAYFN